MDIKTAISLIAALGLGAIVAAAFARWSAISQLRQAWIDGLRKEIAEYFHAIERFSEAAHASASSPIKAEKRARRDQALYAYRQIALRLNYEERDHWLLDKKLLDLLVVGKSGDEEKVSEALIAARRVLKAEWERTKFGPFLRIARKVKRFFRWINGPAFPAPDESPPEIPRLRTFD